MPRRSTTKNLAAVLGLLLMPPLWGRQIESEDLAEPSEAVEPAPPSPTETEAAPSQRFELEAAAEEEYLQGNLDRAASLYEDLGRILDEPDLKLRYWTLAAWLRHELGEELRARELLLRGLRIHPEYELPAARYPQPFVALYRSAEAEIERARMERAADQVRRGVASLEAENWDEARERLDRALELAPDHPVALYNRGLVDLRTGDDQAAIDTFERLASLDIGNESTLSDPLRARVEASLGLLYLRREYFEDSRTHLRTAVELDPSQGSSWTNLGLALRGLGDETGAREAFLRAWEISPGSPPEASNLATSHLRLGQAAEAARILREAARSGARDGGLWVNLGLAEKELGDLGAAAAAFRRALEIDPEGTGGRVATYLAQVEYQRGDFAASEAAARRAVEIDPSGVEAWSYLGLSTQKQGEIIEAQRAFRRAVELDPDRPERQNNLGTVLVALGDHEGAAAAFRKAVELDPEFVAARENLRQIEAMLARRQAAEGGETRDRRRTRELGIRFDPTDFSYLGIQGAVVEDVKSRSPADRGGLREGDVILGVDGRKIAGPEDFLRYVHEEAPGDTVQVDILRDDRPKRLLIEIR